MQHGLLRVLLTVMAGRRHELNDPSEQLETTDRVGCAGETRPRETLETSCLNASFRWLGPREVTEHCIARLPEGVRTTELAHGGFGAYDVSRHRQCESGLFV